MDCQEVLEVHEQMADTKSLAEAMCSQAFQNLIRDHFIVSTTRDELANLMFTYTRLVLGARNLPGGATPHSLYQSLCQEAYAYFRLSIAEAQGRTQFDVDVLRTMANEQH